MVKAINPGASTLVLAVSDTQHRIRVVAAGQPVGNASLDQTMGLGTGQAYQIGIFGIAANDDNGGNAHLVMTFWVSRT